MGQNAGKGAHDLSFKGDIERTAVNTACCKLREGPNMSRKGLCCASVEEGPDGAKERDSQGQRLLASLVAAPVVACEHWTANVVT